MVDRIIPPITLEETGLILKNFEGRATEFNPDGARNFGVLLRPDQAEAAEADGWRVRWLKPRDEDSEPQPWIKCSVAWRKRNGERVKFAPRIVMITGRGKSSVTEQTAKMLDWADIESVDITMNPYQNREGVANGYLKTLYVKVREDAFESKYYDIPDVDVPDDSSSEDEAEY